MSPPGPPLRQVASKAKRVTSASARTKKDTCVQPDLEPLRVARVCPFQMTSTPLVFEFLPKNPEQNGQTYFIQSLGFGGEILKDPAAAPARIHPKHGHAFVRVVPIGFMNDDFDPAAGIGFPTRNGRSHHVPGIMGRRQIFKRPVHHQIIGTIPGFDQAEVVDQGAQVVLVPQTGQDQHEPRLPGA